MRYEFACAYCLGPCEKVEQQVIVKMNQGKDGLMGPAQGGK